MEEKRYTLYYSERCSNCSTFIAEVNKVPDVADAMSFVNIETSPFPEALRVVPGVVEGGSLSQGKDAFRWLVSKKKQAVIPYAYGSSGPSPTTVFSYFDEEVPVGHVQDAFGAFESGDTKDKEDSNGAPGSGVLDAILAQRRSEVPQPIQRQ